MPNRPKGVRPIDALRNPSVIDNKPGQVAESDRARFHREGRERGMTIWKTSDGPQGQ